jgi:hypothetical protein
MKAALRLALAVAGELAIWSLLTEQNYLCPSHCLRTMLVTYDRCTCISALTQQGIQEKATGRCAS